MALTNEQKGRYNELMRIAKGDEYMSMTEFEELLALSKKLGKQSATLADRSVSYPQSYPQGSGIFSSFCQAKHAYEL